MAGVTPRALLVAAVLLVGLAVAAVYLEMVRSLAYIFAGGVPPAAPMMVLFVLLLINPLMAKRNWPHLSRRELLVVFCIVTVALPMFSHGGLVWILSGVSGPYYFARSAPHWEPAFFHYVPAWFAPTDQLAIEGMFLGQAPVPWSLWVSPAAAWGSFFVALFLANLCLVLLLRRQWIRHERLSFPIAMIPLELVSNDGRTPQAGRLPTAWLFWIGFAVAACINLQQQIPRIFPASPSFSTWKLLIPWQRVGPLAGLGDIWLILTTTHIAIAYLIPKELSFSVWFFWLVRLGLTIAAIAAGATPQKPEDFWGSGFPAPYYQGGGAMLALMALLVWATAKQIRLSRRAPEDPPSRDGREPFAHHWLLLGFAIAVGYLVWFLWAGGARVFVAVMLLAGIFVFHIIYARLRAENGMSFMGLPLSVRNMLLDPLGSAFYRPGDVVAITATRWTYHVGWGEGTDAMVGSAFDSYKIADSARIAERRLTYALLGGLLLCLVFGVPLVLSVMYRYGFVNMHNFEGDWLHGQVRNGGGMIFDALNEPAKPDRAALAGMGAGAALTIFLNAMRLRFWWWPFHPIGYLVANAWGTQWWYMPFFVGWLLKTLVVRYGGLRVYQRTVILAIGAIVGDRLVDNLWPLAELLARAYL